MIDNFESALNKERKAWKRIKEICKDDRNVENYFKNYYKKNIPHISYRGKVLPY